MTVKEIRCFGNCKLANHPGLLEGILEANNSEEFIHKWGDKHVDGCSGPLIVKSEDRVYIQSPNCLKLVIGEK